MEYEITSETVQDIIVITKTLTLDRCNKVRAELIGSMSLDQFKIKVNKSIYKTINYKELIESLDSFKTGQETILDIMLMTKTNIILNFYLRFYCKNWNNSRLFNYNLLYYSFKKRIKSNVIGVFYEKNKTKNLSKKARKITRQ